MGLKGKGRFLCDMIANSCGVCLSIERDVIWKGLFVAFPICCVLFFWAKFLVCALIGLVVVGFEGVFVNQVGTRLLDEDRKTTIEVD